MLFSFQFMGEVSERERRVTELLQNVVLAGSNILDRHNHVSWADLPAEDGAAAATALMVGLEENAALLAQSVTSEKIIIKPTANICKLLINIFLYLLHLTLNFAITTM